VSLFLYGFFGIIYTVMKENGREDTEWERQMGKDQREET
jgi:hypothetical protein